MAVIFQIYSIYFSFFLFCPTAFLKGVYIYIFLIYTDVEGNTFYLKGSYLYI